MTVGSVMLTKGRASTCSGAHTVSPIADILDAAHGHDVAHGGLLGGYALEAVKGIQAGESKRLGYLLGIIVGFDDGHALREGAAADAANADAAHIIIVIDGGDQHLRRAFQIALGRGDIFQNRVKQRAQVLAGLAQIQRGGAQTGAGIDDGTVQRGFIRAQLDEQIQHLVHHFVAACIRTIHLVDYHDDRQLQCQRLFQHEAGLGHGPFKAVHQQQHAVHHFEHALHFAAEIGMAGGVDDVDLGGLVMHGRVLGQNGNAALTLDIAGVHDTLGHLLVFTENAALLEHFIHQGSLAVVNVGDDGDVAEYRYES